MMLNNRWFLPVAAMVSLLVASCSDGAEDSPCEVGSARACDCPLSPSSGSQVCDVSGWGDCVCSDREQGAGAGSTSPGDGAGGAGVGGHSGGADRTPTEPGPLIDDPLVGSTAGALEGAGEFTPDGWRSLGGCISYDLGQQYVAGYAAVAMKGLTVPLVPPDWNETDKPKIHLFNAGDDTWQNKFKWRFGPTYDPFKVLYRGPEMDGKKGYEPQGADAAELRQQINGGDGNLYEVTWANNTIEFRLDGTLFRTVVFEGDGDFSLSEVRIGTDCEGTWFHPDVVYTHVLVIALPDR